MHTTDELSELLSTPTFTVEEAKEAFESQVETFDIRPFITNPKTRGKEIPVITPIWNKGNNYSENSVAYIEVTLNVGLMKLFGRKEVNTEVPEDEKYLNTDIRLCVQKGKSETYVFSLVYITGDFSYVIKQKNKIKKLSLSDLSGFSGQIRTFDLKGNLLGGYVYKDGEKVGHISLKDKAESGNKAQTRAYEEMCDDHLIEYEECWYTGYEDGEGITWTDEDCYYDYVTETVCYDVWVDDEDKEDPCQNCGSSLCGGGCTETDSEPPISPEERKIQQLVKQLEGMGIDLSKITITQPKTWCGVNGRAVGKTIELCQQFFQDSKTDKDRLSILWHEVYHVQNGHTDRMDEWRKLPDNPGITNIPPYIQNIMDRMYSDSGVSVDKVFYFYDYLHPTSVLSPGYYDNEAAAYKAEIEKFSDVSPGYSDDRLFQQWLQSETGKLSNQYYNKKQ